MRYDIIRNERDEEREDRSGRVRIRHTLTWDIVSDGVLYRECRTRKEAVSEAKILNRAVATPGRTPIAVIHH